MMKEESQEISLRNSFQGKEIKRLTRCKVETLEVLARIHDHFGSASFGQVEVIILKSSRDLYTSPEKS